MPAPIRAASHLARSSDAACCECGLEKKSTDSTTSFRPRSQGCCACPCPCRPVFFGGCGGGRAPPPRPPHSWCPTAGFCGVSQPESCSVHNGRCYVGPGWPGQRHCAVRVPAAQDAGLCEGSHALACHDPCGPPNGAPFPGRCSTTTKTNASRAAHVSICAAVCCRSCAATNGGGLAGMGGQQRGKLNA